MSGGWIHKDDVNKGMLLMADRGFSCMKSGLKTVMEDEGGFYIPCDHGKHYLDGQENEAGRLVGFMKPAP